MEICDAVGSETLAAQPELDPDLQVVLKVLAIQAQAGHGAERRKFSRCPYVAPGWIEWTGPMGHSYRVPIHSRDANEWGVGIVSQTALAAGRPAMLQIAGGEGADVRVRGCIIRCREILPGWHEGAVLFDEEQPALAPAMLEGKV